VWFSFFFFFFLKKKKKKEKNLLSCMDLTPNLKVKGEIVKKLKARCTKLRVFKLLKDECKSNKSSEKLSEVLSIPYYGLKQ
jgi:hypothetical protein